MRGFRWQLLALIISVVLFIVSAVTRLSSPPVSVPTATLPAVTSEAVVTASPTVESTPIPLVTSVPVITGNPSSADVVTYREALIGQVSRLNPLLADSNPVDRDISSLIFEGLMRINEYGEPVEALAKSRIVSGDGLEYVFTLREDVLWQDGVPFTADDVIFTISLLSSRDFPGTPELGAFWRTVETQKLASNIVRFRLTQPLGSFLSNLTIGMLPEHAWRGTTAAQLATHRLNLQPIGTGAYQLEALRSSDGITVDEIDLRFAPVYRQRPEGQSGYAISRISFKLYASYDDALAALGQGSVDGLAARSMSERQALLSTSGVNNHTGIAPSVGMLIFKWDEGDDHRFFKEQRVRTALMTALNRAAPVESRLLNQAIVANSPLLYNSWAYSPEQALPATDTNAAVDLLKRSNIVLPEPAVAEGEATPTPDPTAPLYTFSILAWDNPAITGLAQEFATQWSLRDPTTGSPLLVVNVESVPFETYRTRIENGEFQAAIVELPLGADPDVYAYWHSGQYPDGRNYGGAADDRLSELLERARREPNGVNRVQLYRQFQQDFIERAVAIPLYYPLYTYAVSNRIVGVQLGFLGSPVDRFRTIKDWMFQ